MLSATRGRRRSTLGGRSAEVTSGPMSPRGEPPARAAPLPLGTGAMVGGALSPDAGRDAPPAVAIGAALRECARAADERIPRRRRVGDTIATVRGGTRERIRMSILESFPRLHHQLLLLLLLLPPLSLSLLSPCGALSLPSAVPETLAGVGLAEPGFEVCPRGGSQRDVDRGNRLWPASREISRRFARTRAPRARLWRKICFDLGRGGDVGGPGPIRQIGPGPPKSGLRPKWQPKKRSIAQTRVTSANVRATFSVHHTSGGLPISIVDHL